MSRCKKCILCSICHMRHIMNEEELEECTKFFRNDINVSISSDILEREFQKYINEYQALTKIYSDIVNDKDSRFSNMEPIAKEVTDEFLKNYDKTLEDLNEKMANILLAQYILDRYTGLYKEST